MREIFKPDNCRGCFFYAMLMEFLVVTIFLLIAKLAAVEFSAYLDSFIVASVAGMSLPFLAWGRISLDRQAKASAKQADTDSKRQLSENFTKACEMFAKDDSRILGLHSMWKISEDNIEDYHILVMNILCSFVRNPGITKTSEITGGRGQMRDDVEQVVMLINKRNEKQKKWERDMDWHIDFTGANLRGLHINGGDAWDEADFSKSNMENCVIRDGVLKDVIFSGAKLRNSKWYGIKMIGVQFGGTEMEHTEMNYVKIEQSTHFCYANAMGLVIQKGSSISGVNVLAADFRGAKFSDCAFSGYVNFADSDFRYVTFDFRSKKDLSVIKLSRTIVNGANFTINKIHFMTNEEDSGVLDEHFLESVLNQSNGGNTCVILSDEDSAFVEIEGRKSKVRIKEQMKYDEWIALWREHHKK